jgi:hypothetical protein
VWKVQSESGNMIMLRSQSLSGAHLKRIHSALLQQQLIKLCEKKAKKKAKAAFA